MHHNTKRPRSPVRQKSSNVAKPLVLGKTPIIPKNTTPTTMPTIPSVKNTSVAPSAKPTTLPESDQVSKQEATKFNPQEFVKQYATRNTYDICMIKKFIGKKILIPAKGLLLTPKMREDAKHIKAALLVSDTKFPKSIIMHVVCVQGTMVIVNGYANYLAICSVSYKDIEANDTLKHTEIKLVQLPKVSNGELRILLDYFA